MQDKRALLIFICIGSFTISISGQKLVNSPYSRFNLGWLEPAGSFRSIGMGGVGTSIRDKSSIYYLNPASYSSIDTNSFVFDFGFDYGVNYLSDGSNHNLSNDMNFDHLMMGFPIAKGFGVATGIIPFSNDSYKISESVTKTDPDYDPIAGEYLSVHNGEGNLTKLFMGTGLNMSKYFSAGINMTLIFGNIRRRNEINFNDYYQMFHDNTTEKLQITGINLEYGAQVIAPFKNGYFINGGAAFVAGRHYNSVYKNMAYLYTAYTTIDTLVNITDSTKAYFPETIRLGLSFGKKDKFVAGFDYAQTKWSKGVIPGSAGYLDDTRSLRFGAEYIPDKYSNYSLARRMEYRVGGHFEESYLVIDGRQIKEYGVSFGVGIPLRKTYSKTNLYFDYSRRSGPAGSGLHMENIFTIGASLNLFDIWFLERKYD
jgi:hypothetical protein